MPTIQLLKATVKYPALDPKDFGKGPRINVVCTLPSGEEAKLWGNPDDAIAQLKKGDQITLIFDGKSYKLASENPPQAMPTETALTLPSQSPPDFATRLGQASSQYEQCWQQATALLTRNLNQAPETLPGSVQLINKIAETLFQATA